MPSKKFLDYQVNVPSAPPMPDAMPIPGGPAPGPQGGPNAYPAGGGMGEYGVPVLPKDNVPAQPVIPEGYTGGQVTVGGVLGMHLTRPGLRDKCALLYLHGGGFTIGSAMTAGPLLAHFAETTGLEGYAVEYGLAPWHPFPEGINDCVAFYKGLLDMGYEKIVVGGESAGAGLTLSLAIACKQQGLPMPAVLWCSSPIDDIAMDKRETYVKDFLLDSCPNIQRVYAPDADPTDPLLSPIYADFAGFPPTVLQTGGGESLSACSIRLAEKFARANVEFVLHFGQDMPHTFAMDYLHYPEAANAMAEIVSFVNNWLDME